MIYDKEWLSHSRIWRGKQLTNSHLQVMRVVVMKRCRQTIPCVHVAQVVDVDVYRPCGSYSAAASKSSMTSSIRVHVKVSSILCDTHVLRVVVRDSNDGDIVINWVGKGNHWVISVARRTGVPWLIDWKFS